MYSALFFIMKCILEQKEDLAFAHLLTLSYTVQSTPQFSIAALYSTDNDNRVKSLSKLHKRLISSFTSSSLFQTKLLFHSHAPNKASLNPLFHLHAPYVNRYSIKRQPILNQTTLSSSSKTAASHFNPHNYQVGQKGREVLFAYITMASLRDVLMNPSLLQLEVA